MKNHSRNHPKVHTKNCVRERLLRKRNSLQPQVKIAFSAKPEIESILHRQIIYLGPEDDYVRVQISEDGKSGLIRSDSQENGTHRNNSFCRYDFESQCSSGLLFRLNFLESERGDVIYVYNESGLVSGGINGDYAEVYADWTDLNGNTLIIIVTSGRWVASSGFELEFKCQDQISIPTCSQLMVHHNSESGDRHFSLMCRFKNY